MGVIYRVIHGQKKSCICFLTSRSAFVFSFSLATIETVNSENTQFRKSCESEDELETSYPIRLKGCARTKYCFIPIFVQLVKRDI